MRPSQLHMYHRVSSKRLGWIAGVVAVCLLVAFFLLSGCSSKDDGRNVPGTSATLEPSDGEAMDGAPVPQIGGPGPDGVGRVVATSDGSGTYIDITPDELAAMLENKDFLLINTHIPYEGEIGETDLFLPFDEAAQQLDQLPVDKGAKIVAYCRSDRMSRIAVEVWVKAGYTNLYNLDGGFVAWEQAGYELQRK